MTTTIGPVAARQGRSMVVLRLGERDDEADLRELAADPAPGAAIVCLLGDDVEASPRAMDDCEALARFRPVVLVRHPSIDPRRVNRADPQIGAVAAAVRGAVDGAADADAPGLREVVVDSAS